MTTIFLVVAIVSSIAFLTFVLMSIDGYEDTMMATLVGHEVDELVTTLVQEPDAAMPYTATVKAYLRSRDRLVPVPDFLRALAPNQYPRIRDGQKIYHVNVFDINNDRVYVAFDTTDIAHSRRRLENILVAGGVLATLVLLASGIWLSRKFLLPVTKLARDVAGIDLKDPRPVFEGKYQRYEVGLIARAVDQFLLRLAEFIEREQSFTAAASHELRTPVAVVTSSIDLLEQKGLNTEQQRVVSRVREATDYMINVIESLLTLARASSDGIEKTIPEIDLHAVVSDITRDHEAIASAKNLELEYRLEGDYKARILKTHLDIILGNLIRNAVNNTSEGEIEVTLHENRLSVRDTGRGIGPDEISMIVKRNYHSLDSDGHGLGLFLVSQFCEIYGMELQIESTPGKGSKFTILLGPGMNSKIAESG